VTTQSTTPGPAAIGADDRELAAGQEVGEYRIEGVIGRGGFGTVYGAVQPIIGKRVAIKVLARKYAADQDIVSRFAAEARAVNQIRHRNIIDIFSFGQLPDGRHYYVMEYLDGEPLDIYIRNHGAMPLDEAIPILRAIARALDAAHAKGIAHRDLKPENIFLAVDPGGRSESGHLDLGPDGGVYPKLLDFGIAKLMAPEDSVMHRTGTGVPIGTPYYMSPEQCRGRDVDHRTDVYSFGIVIYRLLTGAFPFEGDDYMDLLFKQVNDDAPPASSKNPNLPPTVDNAIAWMLTKDREQRPQSVLEAVNALDPAAAMAALSRSGRPSGSSLSRSGKPASSLALAETSISSPNAHATQLASGQGTAPGSKRGLWIAGAFVTLALLGTGLYITTREEPRVVAPKVVEITDAAPPKPEPVVVPPADAAAHPDYVTIEIRAAKGELPAGTIVTLAGKQMGTAPKLSLPYGTTELNLTVEAPAYLPAPLSVTPTENRIYEIKLTKRPRGMTKPTRDDLIKFPGAAE
jgi:eukaryotic-like serine/threonine-protein kinase